MARSTSDKVPDAVALAGNSGQGRRPAAMWLPIVLAAATFGTYAWACGAEFVSWDDPIHVYANPGLISPTIASLANFWRHPYQHLYIPLTYSMWWLLALVGRVPAANRAGVELNPWLFHSASVLLQCVSAVLVWRLLRALAGADPPAAAGALLWALHPLQVESVAWVSAGKDQLSGVLAIGALLAFCTSGSQVPTQPNRQRDWIATLLFAAALLAKPAAVAVPLMAGVLVMYFPRRPRRWRWLALWVGLALVDVLITTIAQPVAIPADGGRWWLRPMIACDSLEFYFLKLVAPIGLSIQYHRDAATVIARGWSHLRWIVPLIVVAIAWGMRRRARYVLAGTLVFIAGLAPTIGLAPFDYQSVSDVADHYAHVALLGAALALACGLAAAPRRGRIIIWTATGAALLACAELSIVQTSVWRDGPMLYKHALVVDQRNWVASMNLGVIYQTAGFDHEAIPYFQQALQYQTQSAALFHDYANAMAKTGQFDKAESAYRVSAHLDANDPRLMQDWALMHELRQQAQQSHAPATSSSGGRPH